MQLCTLRCNLPPFASAVDLMRRKHRHDAMLGAVPAPAAAAACGLPREEYILTYLDIEHIITEPHDPWRHPYKWIRLDRREWRMFLSTASQVSIGDKAHIGFPSTICQCWLWGRAAA